VRPKAHKDLLDLSGLLRKLGEAHFRVAKAQGVAKNQPKRRATAY